MESHPWVPNSSRKIFNEMLSEVGANDIEDLFSDIPKEIREKAKIDLEIEQPIPEYFVWRKVKQILKRNKSLLELKCFRGAGCWPHYVPAVVKEIVRRSEFYTSYTPYQAEISQGMLQALFEYQSMIADLTGMEVVNASLYDGSTALAEAILMAKRVNGRSKVLVPRTMNPQYLEVVRTYTKYQGIKIVEVNYCKETGYMDRDDLQNKIDDNTAAVCLEVPSFLGFIEEKPDDIAEIAHSKGALLVVSVDPISLGILKPPADYGADIVVGEGQPLGLGLNYGGPLLGIFGVRDLKLARKMPGRLIGMTTTLDGSQRGFCMVWQTREQHIRRERATSNICTNEALCAIAAAVYLSLLGPKGLRKLCETILYNSHYLAKQLSSIEGVIAPLFKSAFFKEFVVDFSKIGINVEHINRELLKRNIIGGLELSKYFSELENAALFCTTEIHTKEDLDYLVEALKEIISGENNV